MTYSRARAAADRAYMERSSKREIARGVRDIDKAKRSERRREILELLRQARQAARRRIREAMAACRAARKSAALRARAQRAAAKEAARHAAELQRAAARADRARECQARVAKARAAGADGMARLRARMQIEKVAHEAAKRADRQQRRAVKVTSKPSAKQTERASGKGRETDDEVAANIPHELLGLWRKRASMTTGSAYRSRTEEFLEWIEEHRADVAQHVNEEIARDVKALEREERALHKTRAAELKAEHVEKRNKQRSDKAAAAAAAKHRAQAKRDAAQAKRRARDDERERTAHMDAAASKRDRAVTRLFAERDATAAKLAGDAYDPALSPAQNAARGRSAMQRDSETANAKRDKLATAKRRAAARKVAATAADRAARRAALADVPF